jgi:hypothetical protein
MKNEKANRTILSDTFKIVLILLVFMGLGYMVISGLGFLDASLPVNTLVQIAYGIGGLVIFLLFARSYKKQREQREGDGQEGIAELETDREREGPRDLDDLRERIRRRKAERKQDGRR